jgi:hypothetical protein
MMRTTLICGSLILGVVPFLSHSVLYVQSAISQLNETKHANLKNKAHEFFERELRWLSSSKTCIKGLEASYMVGYRVARTGKPHTIVEDLISPAAPDMAGTMLGGKAKNHTAFIKQHCFTMHQ